MLILVQSLSIEGNGCFAIEHSRYIKYSFGVRPNLLQTDKKHYAGGFDASHDRTNFTDAMCATKIGAINRGRCKWVLCVVDLFDALWLYIKSTIFHSELLLCKGVELDLK